MRNAGEGGLPGGRYQDIFLWADLDGTLLNPERQLDSENLAALALFEREGGRFGVATGRSEHSLARNFPQLRATLPCVFYNGALLQWHPDGPVLRSMTLSREPVALLAGLRRACPDVGIEVLCGGRAWMVHRSEALDAQLDREGLHGKEAGLEEIPPGWYKVLLGGPPDSLAQARRYLSDRTGGAYALVYSEQTLLEVLEPGISKGDAIRHCLSVLVEEGGPAPLVVAVGDNDNDVDMIAGADLGLAMANGSPAALRAASGMLSTNRSACLPQVLRQIDRWRGQG